MNTAEFLMISSMTVPDREALVQGATRVTFMEMADRVKRLANGLQALGVEKGSHVVTLAMNSPAFVETYYACATLGAVFVPLNYRAKQEELTYMINTAGADVVFVAERYLPLLNDIRDTLTSVKHTICYDASPEGAKNYEQLIAANEPDDIFTEIDDADPTIIIYTSGTTAMPKGVMLTHGGMTEYVLTGVEMANPEEENPDVMLVSVPFFHVAGATTMCLAVYAGRKLVILPQFTEAGWLKAVQDEQVTMSFVVPTMLKRMMDFQDFYDYNLSSLKAITYGAAPMPYEVVRRAVDVFPDVDLNNAYGQTETNSTLTFLGPEDHKIAGLSGEELETKLKRLRSVGRPRDDVAVFIVDNSNNILGPNEEGEICVVSARVMTGYYGNEEATQEAIQDGMLHTGDIGYLDDENYLFITGRKKDLIIRGGENISPGEIEGVLTSHPKIDDAAVIGVPDVEWGEVVKAVVVPAEGEPPTAAELIAYTKERLASFKAPQYFAFVEELPRNPMGKVLKTDLRKLYGQPQHDIPAGARGVRARPLTRKVWHMPLSQQEKAERFRALHEGPSAFVIPNPWDAGSARVLAGLGFQALATSSGASAGVLGRRDGAVTREEALAMAGAIVEATDLPVSADLEKCFGDEPEVAAETIRLAAGVGLVGGSIEDATGDRDRPLFDLAQATERVAAAVAVARALPFPFTLTARTENFLRGNPDLADTIARLQAFERAGADVLMAPGLPDLDAVRAVCAAVSKPVNFMAGIRGRSFTVADLEAAGVRRISLAGSLYRAAMTSLVAAAREVKDAGSFGYLDTALPTPELNAFMQE